MEYEIRTIYIREDFEGLYDTFSSKKKSIPIYKKVINMISIIIAALFWGLIVVLFIKSIVTSGIRDFKYFLHSILIIWAGIVIFYVSRRSFKVKEMWKRYHDKGEEIVFRFLPDKLVISERNSETKVNYAGIVRLYEDDKRFYLFTSERYAYILPKRDFITEIDEFSNFITSVTKLQIEHN